MIDALLFWIVVAGVGLVAVPLTELLFPRLSGLGLVFARPVGLLAMVFPLWLLASLHLVPYTRGTAFAGVGILVAGSAILWRRGFGRIVAASQGRSVWIAGEVLFTVAFCVWSLLRSFEPTVWQTEKPMDMALVNVVNRSEWFPPHDPWQAGTNVNYYYFGHYIVAFLVRITGIDPAVGYNLGVALFYSLATTAVFGVTAVLYWAARRGGGAPARSPILVGLTAAALATVVGNVDGGVQLLRHTDRITTYDWWAPSRVIDGTANEFPFFSFLLADLHAHVMVTSFALVAAAYAIQLALEGPPRWRAGRLPAVAELSLAATVLGAIYSLNSFDYPTACVIGVGALLLWALAAPGRWQSAIAWGGCWLVGSLLLFLPFWIGFSPPAKGIALIRERTQFSDFAGDYLLIYGLPLWVVLALFAGRFRVPVRYAAWGGAVCLFALVLLSPPRLSGIAVALALAAVAAFVTFSTGRLSQPQRVLWMLAAVALGLIAAGEVVYLQDAFDGTSSFRFNTVFKTGYQAWFLFAIIAGVGVHWSASWLGRRVRAAWLLGLSCLVALTLVYPALASYSRLLEFRQTPTLDGMRWIERTAPSDAAAIEWLRNSVSGSPTLLETVGRDFDARGRGRVSTFTGLPAVMQWPGHEVQWGHDPASRFADVQLMYRTENLSLARTLLRRYGVRYVFVGTLERGDYAADELAKFNRLGTVAFRSGETVVYRVHGSGPELAAPAHP
jgi:YYY domain-containing protein